MPQDNKQKKEIFNAKMVLLKRKRKEFWLTDSEHLQMKDHLATLRSKTPNALSCASGCK